MTKLFEFHFLDIYNEEYVISIYDSAGTMQGEIKTAKLYGQDGFILSYEKENVDIVQGGIIKSDLTFSVVNENGILDDFLKNLQTYENRYLVEINPSVGFSFWRGVMLNDYITFDDSKLQVVKFNCTDGLGLLQNIDYTDDISKLDSTAMQFDSDAYGNGLIDVISRALSFNPVTKFFEGGYNYIYYTADYISEDMLNDWDALVYTNILKHKADTTLLTTPFADYTIKQTLAGNRIKVYEYRSCYDVINECLKVFNLCLCQRNGVWQIFNIRDFENNKDSYGYYVAGYNDYNYYKNSKYNTSRGSFSNTKYAIGGTNTNKRGSGEFGLNTVVKKIEQKYVPYYVKEGTFNNLIYSGNHGGDLQWYSYPHGVITGISNGNVVYESNFNNWNLCSKYHYHNELDIFTAMTKLQFLINFAIKYTLDSGSGYVHTSMIKPKMDLNLKINGKWLDSNGNWVDNLPIGNWWHKFTGVFDGYDRVINVNFSKYFDLLIPNQSSGKLVVDFYFRIYTQTNVIGTLPWNFKITNIENNSVLKLVDNNGNDIESIDYVVENNSGILDYELEQAFIDNFSESEENNVLFTAVQDLGLNSYRYKKSKKWRHSDETNYYNLVELRLREIAAMNNHPLLNWQGTIYYDSNSYISYMMFYLIKYNLTVQNYVMFPNRWTFYARKRYAEADLIEVSKDFVRVISGNDLAIADFNLPMVPINSGTGTIVTADEGLAIVPANRVNLTANGAVNEIINVSRQNGDTDFVVEYDEDNQEINWKNDSDTLLKITNDGISYKNEKTAGSGIEIDSSNKINVKIDNDTIKLDSNNQLYASVTGFDIKEFLQNSFAIFLLQSGYEKVVVGSYNLLNNVIQQLSSVFFNVSSNNITLDLSSLDNYTNLRAMIEETIDIDYELNDVVFLAQDSNINVYNFANNQVESYIQSWANVDKLYFCKERNSFNKDEQYFNLLFYRNTDNNYIINTIDKTEIQANHYIVCNNLFIYTDGNRIYSVDIDGNETLEANLQIDGFFIYANTLYAYSENDSKTYIRSYNEVWSVYDNVSAVRKIINMYNVNFIAVGVWLDICIYKDKVYGIKSDGIYVYTQGDWLLVNNNVANLTKMQATEKYIYLLDNGYFRYFDGNFIHDTPIQCTDFVAVETDDCILRLDDYYFNGHLSNIQKIQHSANYNYYLYSTNYEVFNMNIKNIIIKNEIKKIENL